MPVNRKKVMGIPALEVADGFASPRKGAGKVNQVSSAPEDVRFLLAEGEISGECTHERYDEKKRNYYWC
jgi:hypothetical protein